MPTREVLSPAQRADILTLPTDLTERELARYYTLTDDDRTLIGKRRGNQNRLGFAVQLCHLRFPGWPWHPSTTLPEPTLQYIARQLELDPGSLDAYATTRDPTRREHLSEIQRVYGFQSLSLAHYRSLAHWLLPVALSTDVGVVLVQALLDELRLRQIIIPALSTVERLVWETRRRARRQIFTQLTANLSLEQQAQLEELLDVDAELRQTPLAWLRQPAGAAKPGTIVKVLERLQFIRTLQLDPELLHSLHLNRVLQLAREGARSTPQRLMQLDVTRRHAILVAFLLETAASLTDLALDMHDRVILDFLNACRKRTGTEVQTKGPALRATARRYATLGKALLTAHEQQADLQAALEAITSWDRLASTVEEAEALITPRDGDYLDDLVHYHPQLRRYAPRLLDALEFNGAPASRSLLKALDLLRALYRGERKKIPSNAPSNFVPQRWEDHVFRSTGIDRTYYEFSTLHELRQRLRSGDVWVAGSRQFKAFHDYLLPDTLWAEYKTLDPFPLNVPPACADYLDEMRDLLDTQLRAVNDQVADGSLPDVRFTQNKLRLSRQEAAVPPESEALVRNLYMLVPPIKLTDLILEVDASVGFSRHATHLISGAAPTDRQGLYSVILADAINLGLTRMAQACPGMTFDRLAWIEDWYLREDTYTKMLAELVNRLHEHPFAAFWGDGSTSSSDTQWFATGGRRMANAQINAKYSRGPGLKIGTHLSDRYGPFYTGIITSTAHEAPYVVDGLMNHQTNVVIREHYTDTGGYTEHVFATLRLLGFRFAPRIRNLHDLSLYSLTPADTYPTIAPVVRGSIDRKRLEAHWDDILRMGASIKQGIVPASLILNKLAASPRQNGLAQALRDMGHLERTAFHLDWLQSRALRRRATAGLNKGESRNALARALSFNRQGAFHDRTYEDQLHRASGLNLVIAAIALWNTTHLARAVAVLRGRGVEVPDALLAHVSPLHWDHILFTGDYNWSRGLKTNLEELRPLPKASQSAEAP